MAWERGAPVLPASLFRRSLFEQVGYFDAALRSGEDLLWLGRARATGVALTECAAAQCVYSHFPALPTARARKWFEYEHSVSRVRSACVDIIDRYRAALGESLRGHGRVERWIVAAAMSAADVLVNIGNDSLTQLPSKVVEYASTGRPVVSFDASENDTSEAFFAGYPNARNMVHHGARANAEQARALAAFIDSAPARVPDPVLENFLAPYLPEAVVGRYRSILGRARAGRLP